MGIPKLHLWAKYIQSGRYDDYDTPPNIPFITGAPTPLGSKKPNVATALAGAATAIVKALSGSPKKNISERVDEGAKMSPLKMATLRRNCLDDLKKLKELFEDNVLSEEEFTEEKKHILASLQGLK